jgi:segregation and condensation protein B
MDRQAMSRIPWHGPSAGGRLRPAAARGPSSAFRWAWSIRRARPSRPPQTRSEKLARLEAALFVADGPQSTRKIVQDALLADTAEANRLVDELNEQLERQRSALRVEKVAAGLQMMTRPELAPWLDRLHQRAERMKLSASAMETLTIIAYRQPITRADLEAVRGAHSSDMIKQLIERRLVRVAGEDDSLGRPFLYETTREFLAEFGLRSLAQLPPLEEGAA